MSALVVTQIEGHIILENVTFLSQPLDLKVGTVIEIPDHGLRIGRATDNDLVLPSVSISRFHFRLVREGDHYVYEDIGSRQVPIYNGRAIGLRGRRAVNDGDTFNAAGIFFRYGDRN